MDKEAPVAYTGTKIEFRSGYNPLFTLASSRFVNGTIGKCYSYDSYLGRITAGNSNFGITHMDYVTPTSAWNITGSLPVDFSPKLD